MVADSPIAGENYTLECLAGGFEGTFQWLGPPDGRTPVVESGPRLNIISNATSSQLQYRPTQQSDNGSYSCSAAVGGLSLLSEPVVISVNGNTIPDAFIHNHASIIIILSPAPSVLVQINDGGVTPTLREDYQLTCSVSGAENLNPTITYQWMKNSGSGHTQLETNSNTLSFTRLQLSDAASYVCTVTVTSSYLTGDIVVVNSQDIRIQSRIKSIFSLCSKFFAHSYSSNPIFYCICQ